MMGRKALIGILVLLGIGIAAGYYFYYRLPAQPLAEQSSAAQSGAEEETVPSLEVDPHAPTPSPDDFFIGNADAPVTVIEYFSLSCPHCADFAKNTLPEIKKEYIDQGKVRWIFRDFPLNKPALEAAMLAHCQSPLQYTNTLDYLFQTADQWLVQESQPALAKLARNAGMDDATFQQCMANDQLKQKIIESRANASTLGVNATPTFYINGIKVGGAQPFNKFKTIIDGVLKKKS